MKRIISLLLCIVLMCFALVSCDDGEIGSYLPNYNLDLNNKDSLVTLNFYIIVGEGTSAEAMTTVPQNINTYLKEQYNIALNIVYCTESEYDAKVIEAAKKTDDASRADIVLINSLELFETLYSEGLVKDLTDFYNSKTYRSINAIVDDNLLAASLIREDKDGKETQHYYTVPNNHLIGSYKYIVIDKTVARDTLHFSNSEIEAMVTEESLAELKDEMGKHYDATPELAAEFATKDDYINSYVRIVVGNYEDMTLLTYGVDDLDDITIDSRAENFVNIAEYPNPTKEEAFASAFAVIKNIGDEGDLTEAEEAVFNKHYSKCMDIIYALNTDVQLKNMLQYGYVGTNYKFIKNEKNENTDYIELYRGEAVIYNMNPIYTGNLYISYYCEEIGWNANVYSNTIRQNADARVPVSEN